MSRFLGVDLHKNVFTVNFYDKSTETHKTSNYKLKNIESFKHELLKDDVVGVEMTGNTSHFVSKIKDKVKDVKILNPLRLSAISKSVKKTDKNDARTISELLSMGNLSEVVLKDELTAQISSIANTRDKFVHLRTTLKNKIHGLLNAYGIVVKRDSLSSKKSLLAVLKYNIPPIAKTELEVIVHQIESLNESIKKLDKEIEKCGKSLDGIKNITSIKGIGEKSGAILLSVIGDINRFKDAKRLAAYFGIVPIVRQSNEKEWHGHITKHGNKLGRTTLVQCTWVAIKYSKYLRAFYEKLKAKKGSGKAIIATAKKLLGIIYNTLKNKWVFEDFPNYVIKTV